MSARLTIAIDGPAGSGKSTAAQRTAALLGYLYLDSGAMYRAVALKALERKIPLEDEAALEALTRETRIELKPPTPEQETAGLKNRVFLDRREVTEEIRTAEVAQAASRLATIAGVREVLVAEQQRAGQGGGVVMEGRDIGTVVCPAAPAKFFLDADPSVRGRRRFREQGGGRGAARQVLAAIRERDRRDQGRRVAPLRAAPDAVRIDTTGLTLEQVVDKMLAVLDGRGILLSFDRLRRAPHR